jgi:hypothetical protein
MRKGLLFNLLLLMSILLPACLEDSEDVTPRSEVPAALAKKWMAGAFSMTEFWQYDGTYSGNAFEAGLAFDFTPEGDCAFYLVAGGTSYGCRNEAFVYKKGTVQFNLDDQSFTFYPTEGNNRGFFRGCGSSFQNYNKKAEKKDLTPETYYYSLQQGSNGEDQLVIRFKKDDTSSTIFRPMNW